MNININIKLLSNISYRALFVILSKLLSLLVVPILTRYLGPSRFGEYNYVLTLINYCTIGIDFGFLAYGTRTIAEENSSKSVSIILSTRIFVGILSILVILFSSIFIPILLKYFLLFFLIIFFESFILDFFFYGFKNVFIPTLANFISQVLLLFLIILTTIYNLGFNFILYSYAFTRAIEALIIIVFYIKQNKIRIILNVKEILITFKKIFPLGFGNKLSFFQNSLPVLIIPYFLNYESLGYYSGFMKFSTLISMIFQIMLFPMGPFIVEKKLLFRRKKNIMYYLLFFITVGLIISLLIFLTREISVELLLGEKFLEVINIFPIGCFTILFIQPLYLGVITLINYIGDDKIFFRVSVVSFVFALVLIPLLLYIYSLNGVFYGSFISSIVFIFLLVYYLMKQTK
jgi:PST family polysaccharide transporter